jgi:hypothetical protein
MKIIINNKEQKFTPIQITLTLETYEEAEEVLEVFNESSAFPMQVWRTLRNFLRGKDNVN